MKMESFLPVARVGHVSKGILCVIRHVEYMASLSTFKWIQQRSSVKNNNNNNNTFFHRLGTGHRTVGRTTVR